MGTNTSKGKIYCIILRGMIDIGVYGKIDDIDEQRCS
jgi:hypothetical protein